MCSFVCFGSRLQRNPKRINPINPINPKDRGFEIEGLWFLCIGWLWLFRVSGLGVFEVLVRFWF